MSKMCLLDLNNILGLFGANHYELYQDYKTTYGSVVESTLTSNCDNCERY